jgi:MtN3 and saliva related transmembrane protein
MEFIGYLAAFLTTSSFIPQVISIYKTKRTDDISLLMYIIFIFGISLWAVYGIYLKSTPMTIANIITLMFALYILYMKLTESKRKLIAIAELE